MKFIKYLDFDFIEFLPFKIRPFKARLNPAQIWIDLDSYKDDIFGLQHYCKKWKTKVVFERESHINIGGEYDSVDNQITLFIYSPNFPKLKFSQKGTTWEDFKYQFIQTLMHEMIHFMQYRNRSDSDSKMTGVYYYKVSGDKETDEQREYFSEFDEIQAYAHCIYLDYKCFGGYNIPILELLKYCKTNEKSFTMTAFLEAFDYEFNGNYGLQRLLKEIIRWDNKYKIYHF